TIPHTLTPCDPRLLRSFSFTVTATTAIYTLSLHDALPISGTWRSENERSADASGGDLSPPLCDRGRRDRWLLPAVSLAQGSSATRGSSSVCGESRPLRLVAFASSGRGGSDLCGVWRGLRCDRPVVAPARGWRASRHVGHCGFGVGRRRDVCHHVWSSPCVSNAAARGRHGVLGRGQARPCQRAIPISRR